MDTDYQTDDEAIREIGFTDGPQKALGLTFRPVTALSLSWMQRNKVFADDFGDMLQKTAAYAYLHSADKIDIRGVVNDRLKFLEAVDEWMDSHVKHHTELEPVAKMMNDALEGYMAAITKPANPSSPNGPKN